MMITEDIYILLTLKQPLKKTKQLSLVNQQRRLSEIMKKMLKQFKEDRKRWKNEQITVGQIKMHSKNGRVNQL